MKPPTSKKEFDLWLIKQVKRAKCVAARRGYFDCCEDFGQDVAVKYLQGRKATIDQLWIDFIRLKFGDNRSPHWRTDKYKELTVKNGGRVDPKQEENLTLWMQFKDFTPDQQELILMLSKGCSGRDIAAYYGRTPGAISTRINNLRDRIIELTDS